MKSWINKLVSQFDGNWPTTTKRKSSGSNQIVASGPNEQLATVIYLLDAYSKHLIEIDSKSIRKIRDEIDEMIKSLISIQDPKLIEDQLFHIRKFFNSHRIEEHNYVAKLSDDFRTIIWNFIEQLGKDFSAEKKEDSEIQDQIDMLKDCMDSNSLNQLKEQSKNFIESYKAIQKKKKSRIEKRTENFKKNLDDIQKKLVDANHSMRHDHLTGALNRKSFDEQLRGLHTYFQMTDHPISLIILDIDFFKKINDSYGHPMGDFILQECVKMLKEIFSRENDVVARIGGEEFAVLLPHFSYEHAIKKAEDALKKIRTEVFVKNDIKLSFTVSMGIAQLIAGEDFSSWMKRADEALYTSKKSGRDKYTVSDKNLSTKLVA